MQEAFAKGLFLVVKDYFVVACIILLVIILLIVIGVRLNKIASSIRERLF